MKQEEKLGYREVCTEELLEIRKEDGDLNVLCSLQEFDGGKALSSPYIC